MHPDLHQICLKNAITPEEYSQYGGIPPSYDIYPYAPFIPTRWNKIMVLAESQQLRRKSKGNNAYAIRLMEVVIKGQIFRLGNEKITGTPPDIQLGITPWDEGYIKLAMLAAFPQYTIDQYAVSNAIPWHLDKSWEKKAQADFLKRKSVAFWAAVFPVLEPEIIICTGRIANSVIARTVYCSDDGCRKFHIRSASQLHFVVRKTYDYEGWLKKNPAVNKILRENSHLIRSKEPHRQFVYYIEQALDKIIGNYH